MPTINLHPNCPVQLLGTVQNEVIEMSEKRHYAKNLNALLSSSESAKTYFMALPDYIQGMIQQRTCDVHSMDELRRYAETMLGSQ